MHDPSEELAWQFLLKEYDTANEVTFHADTFRDKLSAFFLSFAGAAVTVVLLVLKGESKVGEPSMIAGSFFIGVSLLGTVILLIHARLRRVQLENFAIICRIRAYFFRNRYELWDIVRLTPETLPKIKFSDFKGSELWATSIIVPVAALLAGGIALIWGERKWMFSDQRWYCAAGLLIVVSVLLWCWYAKLATYKPMYASSEICRKDIDTWLKNYGLRNIVDEPNTTVGGQS
jgi:hypothetical protein